MTTIKDAAGIEGICSYPDKKIGTGSGEISVLRVGIREVSPMAIGIIVVGSNEPMERSEASRSNEGPNVKLFEI